MKVFISHSSLDKWVARQISRLLEADGHATFLDEKDIKTGESIDAMIQVHLKESDHLLLLISPASLKSHWVFVELGGAKALGKHVVPILLHVGSNELPGPITSLLARDLNDLDKYLSELKALAAKPATAAKAVSTGVEKPRPKSNRRHLNGFAVGDEVKIALVEHLTAEDKEKGGKWTPNMDKFSGAVSKIVAFSPAGNAFLELTGDKYVWHLDWLAKVG